jgi:hypothetical protein
MRMDLSTGKTTEIIPSSPRIEARTGALAGGSLKLIFGKGFADTEVSVNTFPASSTLGGHSQATLAKVSTRPGP